MIKNCKAILLDVDNTLLDFNLCAKEAMIQTFSLWKLSYKEEMFPIFLECNDFLWEEIEKNHITREELYKIRWKMIFEKLGILGIDHVAFDAHFRKGIGESAVPIDGAYVLLEYLARKYILCIASNASHARQVKRLKKANMMPYVAHLFSSEQIGHPKPEEAFFDACLANLAGIKREEVVVIGDSLSADIAGGKRSGMQTIWFNYKHEKSSGVYHPDYTVDDLTDILNIL